MPRAHGGMEDIKRSLLGKCSAKTKDSTAYQQTLILSKELTDVEIHVDFFELPLLSSVCAP